MKTLPKALIKTIEFFERLPNIGPKTAKRLGFFLLKIPQTDLDDFAASLINLKKSSLRCQICLNLTEGEICDICQDPQRNQNLIAVVEDVLDLLSMEFGNKYDGVYHVLHGRIDPLNYQGPDDIFISHLIKRVEKSKKIKEIILATNPNLEGEATAIYIKHELKNVKKSHGLDFKITRLAYGLPIGADLEYADYMTLSRALEGRREF